MTRRTLQFVTTLFTTPVVVAMTLPFLLVLSIGLFLASIKEIFNYLSRLLHASHREPISVRQEPAIPIVQINKN